ncbi:hypothetical protein ZHAS_00009684 [Anopheles sinensis]|uniref:Uncharacterized protein n=1 Tax=Anopheles sinensis TaxID=74873 RepID=A0A084VV49_ANOSI|nr:hypothetical protein ZHAS_00009684 [Anopheles sinensis]
MELASTSSASLHLSPSLVAFSARNKPGPASTERFEEYGDIIRTKHRLLPRRACSNPDVSPDAVRSCLCVQHRTPSSALQEACKRGEMDV